MICQRDIKHLHKLVTVSEIRVKKTLLNNNDGDDDDDETQTNL